MSVSYHLGHETDTMYVFLAANTFKFRVGIDSTFNFVVRIANTGSYKSVRRIGTAYVNFLREGQTGLKSQHNHNKGALWGSYLVVVLGEF